MKNWEGSEGAVGVYMRQSPEYHDCHYEIRPSGHPVLARLHTIERSWISSTGRVGGGGEGGENLRQVLLTGSQDVVL